MHENKRVCARNVLRCLDIVKEKDVHVELEIGHHNMTAMEATMEHLKMERAKGMKGGGAKYDGTAEHTTKLKRTCGVYGRIIVRHG